MTKRLLLLTDLARFGDAALLALRIYVGVFLMCGTWDNVTSTARMEEFAGFLSSVGSPMPEIAAPVSVYAQFICGALILLGLLTRWAGLVMTFNFTVAVWLLHDVQDFRELFPPLIMVFVPLFLATHGAGRYSLDARLSG